MNRPFIVAIGIGLTAILVALFLLRTPATPPSASAPLATPTQNDLPESRVFDVAAPGRTDVPHVDASRRATTEPASPDATIPPSVVETATVSGIVTRIGSPVARATVALLSSSGTLAPTEIESNVDGTFAFTNVVPGGYTISARLDWDTSTGETIDVAPGEARHIDLALPSCAISGRVTGCLRRASSTITVS
jgi:hypothetical protein